jgi:hypothetical protein
MLAQMGYALFLNKGQYPCKNKARASISTKLNDQRSRKRGGYYIGKVDARNFRFDGNLIRFR